MGLFLPACVSEALIASRVLHVLVFPFFVISLELRLLCKAAAYCTRMIDLCRGAVCVSPLV